MSRRRLIGQLFPSYLLIIVLSLLAVSWYASKTVRSFYFRQTANDLQVRAVLAEEIIKNSVQIGNFEKTDELTKKLGNQTGTRFTVVLPGGKPVADTDENPSQMENHSDRPEIKQALSGETGIANRYSQTLDQNMMYVATAMRADQEIIGVVRVSVPVTSLYDVLRRIYLQIALAGLIVAVIAAVVDLFVSRRIARPLEVIKNGSERFASGDLDHELPVYDSPQEIGALAESMNKMARELNQRICTINKQRSEQETVLSSMLEAVLAVDNDNNLIILNSAAAYMFGTEKESGKGKKLNEIVRNTELLQFIEDVRRSSQIQEKHITLHRDTERHLQTHGTALRDEKSQNIGVLIVLNDITQLRRLENIRRDFVANVSHELKTPITSIKGFVETLLEGQNSKEEIIRFLGIISKQTDRLNAIIDDLLMLSRLEQGKIGLQKTETNLSLPINAAIEICRFRADKKGIKISVNQSDVKAKINEPLFEQAVLNLIDNAIKFSEPGSSIEIETEEKANEVLISVTDHGSGIEKKHQSRLFERFYRVDKARSRKLGGTGLGLAIVKHIISEHGGYVNIQSTLGQGSTFTIHLPK